MPLWTDGKAYVVATALGVARMEAGQSQVSRLSRGAPRRDEEPPQLEVFAVLDAEGTRALVRRRGEPPVLWTAGAGDVTAIEGPDLVAAVGLGGDRLLVAVGAPGPGGRERVVLRQARMAGGAIQLGDAVELPQPGKLAWRSGLWKKGQEPWPEARDDGGADGGFDPAALAVRGPDGWSGTVRLSANRCGVALTSTYSGTVAVLDPATLETRMCARVPAALDAFDLFALPVPGGGALVSLVNDHRNTEYVVADRKAKVVASRHKLGKDLAWGAWSAGVLWSDDKVLVNQQLTGAEMHWLSLPDLKPKRFTGEADVCAADSGSSADGSIHLLALVQAGKPSPQNWRLVRYEARGAKPKRAELEMPDLKPPAPPEPPPNARRAEGPPILGVAADAGPAWSASVGQEVALRLRVSNRGGPLRGLYVEIGGDALSHHLISAAEAAAKGPSVPFASRGSVLRAELADAALDAGFADIKSVPKGSDPTFDLVVRVRGERPGSALMTVRVGPLGASGTSGSALQGRSFSVVPA
jgi:hypothetical protein